MEKKNYYTGLILRYLANEIHPAEEQALKKWLKEDDSHQKLFRELQSNWQANPAQTSKAGAAFAQLADKLNLPDDDSLSVDKRSFSQKYNTYRFKAAASITGLLLIASVLYYLFFGVKTIVHSTGFGETVTLVLPDSSMVTLNANSSLEYHSKWFEKDLREVWLKGEAFFQVRKSIQKPETNSLAKFIVHTRQMDVEVVGTQFNVNDRRGKTIVVLSSGSVRLNSHLIEEKALVMQPGDLVELSANRHRFVRKTVNPEVYSSWKDKKLILNNTTAGEIAEIIEDYYGVKVSFEDSDLAEKTLTGSIPNHNLEAFLTIFSASIGVQAERQGNQLILKNKINP